MHTQTQTDLKLEKYSCIYSGGYVNANRERNQIIILVPRTFVHCSCAVYNCYFIINVKQQNTALTLINQLNLHSEHYTCSEIIPNYYISVPEYYS